MIQNMGEVFSMKLEKRTLSGREKDQAAIELLETLREQLYSANLTIIRQAAFHLSWLQEDGLEVLKEALVTDTSNKRTKTGATYGLRKMRGRMTKPALEVLKEGSESSDPLVAQVARNALDIYHNKRRGIKRPPYHSQPHRRASSNHRPEPGNSRFEIQELPAKRHHRPASRPNRYVRHNGR